jgi:tetratricopeptide (TPR) repeat protein
LIDREYFLTHTKPGGHRVVNVQGVTVAPPKGFKFDIMYAEYNRRLKDKEFDKAGAILDSILSERKGFPHIQYLINDLEKICLHNKDYERLERESQALIERGYTPDNYLRLARVYKAQSRWSDLLDVGAKAMEALGLKFEDFEADCFPFRLGMELNTFTLFMDMGQAALELKDYGGAARYYHLASKLKSNSHKPFLGFAKAYMEAGFLDRAEQALARTPQPGGSNDPESLRIMAGICRKRKNLPLAFECLKKAFEKGPEDENNVDPFYFAGAGLGRWEEMIDPLKNFVLHKEDHAGAHARLASVHFNLKNEFLARESAERALALDPKNPVAKSILERIKKNAKNDPERAQKMADDDTLGLDMNPELLPGLLETTQIVW